MLKKILCAVVLVMVFVASCFARDDNKDRFLNLCKNGTVEEFNRIMKNVGGPNILLDNDDNSPLIIATKWGMFGIVRRLIDMGADVNHSDIFGNTALIWASCFKNLKIMQYLLDHGASLITVDSTGVRNPILDRLYEYHYTHMSTYDYEFYEMIKLLLRNGYSYTDQGKSKNTFVHRLCYDREIELTKMKTFYNLSPDAFKKCLTIRNSRGLTPIDVLKDGNVVKREKREIILFFNELMGKQMLNPYE